MAETCTITRRALVQGAGAALGAAALSEGVVLANGTPAAFDPAAYIADLRAIGCEVYLSQRRSRPGVMGYGIVSPAEMGFSEDFRLVMVRWDAAIAACRDHVERVAAYLSGSFQEAA